MGRDYREMEEREMHNGLWPGERGRYGEVRVLGEEICDINGQLDI